MSLFLLCLLSLFEANAKAVIPEVVTSVADISSRSQTPGAVQAVQGIIDAAYNGLQTDDRTSRSELTDENHNPVPFSCIQDAQCLNERVGHAIKSQAPEGTIVKTLLVFQAPKSGDKKSWADLLQRGEMYLPFEIHGHQVSSHQVLEIKVPSATETYIFDPQIFKVTQLLVRDKWEDMISSRNGVFFKSTEIFR